MTLTTEEAVRHLAAIAARHQAELAEKYPRQEPEHAQLIGCTCTSGYAICVRCLRLAQEAGA